MTSLPIRPCKPKTYQIKGIEAGVTSDSVPLRLEVDSWYPGQNETQLRQNSLFLWALHYFQIKDPADKLSYFQVSGIHGSPFMPWDEDTDAQTANEGYCTHDSLLFPCWHRPYVLLYEQLLYEIMLSEVIPKLPQEKQQAFRDATATFRLPYWDWAQKKKRGGSDTPIYDVPMITKQPRIEVLNLQDGTSTVFIDNPMYKFTMPDGERMGCSGVSDVQDTTSDGTKIVSIPFSKSRGTSRWAPYDPESPAVSVQWENGEVDNNKITEALQDHNWYGQGVDNVPLAEMVYRLFLPGYISSFTQFATTKYRNGDSPSSYLSLEYIHNNVHNWTGGFDSYIGHMTEPPVAAFDPIFYMHHCNVDRQFAIWQALNVHNKLNWFQDSDEQLKDDGTWSIKTDTIDTPKTPLAPFHTDTKGTYFTSDDIRDWMKWGYSYPELQPWLDKYKENGKFDETLYTNDIKYQLKKLYSPAELNNYTADYIINVEYKRFALDGIPYTLYFFIGPRQNLEGYQGPLHMHPDHVGFVYTFSNPVYKNRASPGCEHCRRKAAEGMKSRAQVPITGALLARIQAKPIHKGTDSSIAGLTSLRYLDSVANHLKENLHWRVRTHGGHDVAIPSNDPFIEVSVYHRNTRFDNVGSHELYQRLEHVTRGKLGGFTLP